MNITVNAKSKQPLPQGASFPAAPRLAYLDNLRILLAILVICHHQSIALGAPGGWYFIAHHSPGTFSAALQLMFVAVNQAFFMSLFFFISGYFTHTSLIKKGLVAFVNGRLFRLGMPLLLYFFVLNPIFVFLGRYLSGEWSSTAWMHLKNSYLDLIGFGPLWFVFVLIVFTSIYVLVYRFFPRTTTQADTRPFFDNQKILLFAITLSIVTFFLRLIFPVTQAFCGLLIGYFPLYICLFSLGIVAQKNGWLEKISTRQANCWFYIALSSIIVLPVLAYAGGAFNGYAVSFAGGMHWQAFAYAAWEPLVCIGICLKLICYFRDHITTSNRWCSMLARSSFVVYLSHPIFVIFATLLVRDLPIPSLALLIIASFIAVSFSFSFAAVVRAPARLEGNQT